MKTKLLTLLIFLLTFASCSKNEDQNALLYQTWEAKDFMSIESAAYPKNENTKVLLTFTKSGIYNLKLDINSCGGSFSTSGESVITMESPACTEACCDSKFSEKLAGMLHRVESFEIKGNSLSLHVPEWGFIQLEK